MKHHFLHYMDQVIHNRWRDVAFVDYGEKKQYTHGEVAQQVRRFHKLFRLLGIKQGDKIAIASRNCSNWVVSYMAIMSYKAVAVTLLQDFKAEDLARLIEHSDSKMLIVGPYVWRELQNQPLPELQAIMSMDDFSFIHLAEPYQGNVEHVMTEPSTLTENTFFSLVQDGEIDLDSLALINYTSGSTGSPKGVMISHRSLSNNTENGQYILPVEPGQRVVSMLPLAHMFGQLADFLYPFSAGATIYYLTKAPTPSILLKAMADVKPYLVATVPLVIEKIHKKKLDPLLSKAVLKFCWYTPGIMNLIRGYVKRSLVKAFGGQVRYFLCGGAAMNPIVEKCLMDVNFPLSIGFGMTECGPLISYRDKSEYVKYSCGTNAHPIEIRIDSANPRRVLGEIQVKGDAVMLGYYKNEEATKAAFTSDGWLRTGDMGLFDAKANLFIKGRCKNMILTGSGQNIYPEEIEDKIAQYMEYVQEVLVYDEGGQIIAEVFLNESDYPDARERIKSDMKELNKTMASFKRVNKTIVRDDEFRI